MGRPAFEQLKVYQLAEQLADETWRAVQNWRTLAKNTVGAQMIRAADGIGANIAEGTGRTTYKDNRRFAGMARGSLYETIHWLRRAHVRGLLKPDQTKGLEDLVSNLGPCLNGYLRSIGKQGEHQ